LSESINSMWKWYHQARRCYVLLSDYRGPLGVTEAEEGEEPYRWSEAYLKEEGQGTGDLDAANGVRSEDRLTERLRKCRWFSRA
jgi:hypothetical protein